MLTNTFTQTLRKNGGHKTLKMLIFKLEILKNNER